MAERLGIKTEDVVELELNGKKVNGPVWIQAGHPDNSVTVFSATDARRAGRVGTGAGFDAYALRTSAAPWFATGLQIRKTGDTYELASTQGYQTMDTPDGGHRPLVREATSRNTAKNRTSPRKTNRRRSSRSTSPIPIQKKTTPGAWRST